MMVQCELSKAELLDLDMALMGQLIECKIALRDGQGNTEKLEQNVKRLETLHAKLNKLLELT